MVRIIVFCLALPEVLGCGAARPRQDALCAPDPEVVNAAVLDTTWVSRVEGVEHLGTLRPGARIGLLLRDGSRLSGVYHGPGQLPPEAGTWVTADARRRGYTGPGPGDSLSFRSVRDEWFRGTFHALFGNSLWIQLRGDSIPRACDLRLVAEVRSAGASVPLDSLAARATPGGGPDPRGLWLEADPASAATRAPIAIPLSVVQGYFVLRAPELPADRVPAMATGFAAGILLGGLVDFMLLSTVLFR